MIKAIYQQVIAFAGVFQAADHVKQTAWKGYRESTASTALLHSIFKIDADSVADIYGGISAVHEGLTRLMEQLGDGVQERDIDVSRYTAQLLALQSKLVKNMQAMQQIQEGILQAKQQCTLFGIQHPNTIARLSTVYTDNISPLSPRIMVNGDPSHLNNNATASTIRAVLLAGIRSAVLWRQSGGSRLKLLFNRSHYLRCAESVLEEIEQNNTNG